MKDCDFNCDDCKRTLCTQGNPTLEPKPEEMDQLEDEAQKAFMEAKIDFLSQISKTDPAAGHPEQKK